MSRKKEAEQKKIHAIGDPNPLHPGEKILTRRQFLGANASAFAAGAVLPSVIDLVSPSAFAHAEECPTGGPYSGLVPFLVFDAVGGMSIPGNWVPMDAGGQPLPSYSNLGLRNVNEFIIDTRFGVPMAAPVIINEQPQIFRSEVRDALVDPAVLPANIAANLRMGLFCNESLSDSSANTTSPVSLITTAGLHGLLLDRGLGRVSSSSAGNTLSASLLPEGAARSFSTIDSLTLAVSYGKALSGINPAFREAVAKAVRRLTESQMVRFRNLNLGAQLEALANCNAIKNVAYTAPPTNPVDARTFAAAQTIYGINSGTGANDMNALNATIVMNALNGNVGPGVITIGGCDYHDNTNATGAGRNLQVGTEIARACRMAAAMNKKFIFCVITDGGIASNANDRTWAGDSNSKSSTVMGVFSPNGPVPMLRTQVGAFTVTQDVDRDPYIATNPTRVGHAVFLNYLALCGQLDRYASVATLDTLPGGVRQSLLMFQDGALG